MSGNSSAAGPESFDESLLACVEDINKLLPGLGRRYELTVILSALAEHVGSALKVLMQKKVCNAQQAQQVIKNIESSAFLAKAEQQKAQGSPAEADDPQAPGTPGSRDPDL